jgi:hypothetical protein
MAVEFIPRNERRNKIDIVKQISNAVFGEISEIEFSELFIPKGGRVPNPKVENFANLIIHGPNCLWAIKEVDSIVGFVLIADLPHENSIGFSINSNYANQGIMRTAWKEICSNPAIRYPLYGSTSQNNVSAKKLLLSCGFELDNEFSYSGELSFKYVKRQRC